MTRRGTKAMRRCRRVGGIGLKHRARQLVEEERRTPWNGSSRACMGSWKASWDRTCQAHILVFGLCSHPDWRERRRQHGVCRGPGIPPLLHCMGPLGSRSARISEGAVSTLLICQHEGSTQPRRIEYEFCGLECALCLASPDRNARNLFAAVAFDRTGTAREGAPPAAGSSLLTTWR